MATVLTYFPLVLCLMLFHVRIASPKIVEGFINTKEHWKFISRFCYKDSIGELKYHFEYPKEYAVQNILLYFDSQWPHVYPKPVMKCIDKEDKLTRGNNQVINLTTDYIWSGCKLMEASWDNYFSCDGNRRFISSRERWWYIALSNCNTTKGLNLKYTLEMTNGKGFWRKHFSADERFILPMNIAFFIVFILLWALGIYVATILVSRRLFHFSYKLFLVSTTFEVISLLFSIIYYVQFGQSGIETYGLKVTARAFEYMSHVVFLLLLILLAKGWTVTRGRISSAGQIKLSVFGTLYTTCFAILFFYETAIFDPGEVLYIYESGAGVGICVLRVLAWFWFNYGTFFTLKHFPNKCAFYYPFWFFYTGWFLAGPLVVIIATFKIPKWERSQVVNGIDWSISILAHTVFLVITRPSAANRNFPFHLRTNQIGIQELLPSRPFENGAAAYAVPLGVPPPYYEPGRFTDITSMFLGSEVANVNKPPHQSTNGIQNGQVNGVLTKTINQPIPRQLYGQ